MALDDAERLQVKEIFSAEIEGSLGRKIPRLMRLEEILKPIVAGVALAVAMPLTYFGLNALVEKQAKTTFAELHDKDPAGPMAKLRGFSSRLKETFEGQVDSATFKLLRFGCNAQGVTPASNFPNCVGPSSGATVQAKFALDEEEQTIAFAARPKHQNIKLALALRPVDPQNVLKRVALQIEWIPLDVRSDESPTAKKIALIAEKVNKDDYLVTDPKGSVIVLYGLNDGMEREAMNLEIDLSDAMKDIKSTLHQIRVKAVPLPPALAPLDGTERFFLRALVSVNHRVVAP